MLVELVPSHCWQEVVASTQALESATFPEDLSCCSDYSPAQNCYDEGCWLAYGSVAGDVCCGRGAERAPGDQHAGCLEIHPVKSWVLN